MPVLALEAPDPRLLVERDHPLEQHDELAQPADGAVVVDAEAILVPRPHAAAEPEREAPAGQPVEVEGGHRRLQRAAHERHGDARRQLDVLVARRSGAEAAHGGAKICGDRARRTPRPHAAPRDLVAQVGQPALRQERPVVGGPHPRRGIGRRPHRRHPVRQARTGTSRTLAGRLSTAATAISTTMPPAACTSVTGSSCDRPRGGDGDDVHRQQDQRRPGRRDEAVGPAHHGVADDADDDGHEQQVHPVHPGELAVVVGRDVASKAIGVMNRPAKSVTPHIHSIGLIGVVERARRLMR